MDPPEQLDEGKVRVLIRDAANGMYFRCPGGWVKSRSEAEDFESAVRGITFAVKSGWQDVEVVLELQNEPFQCRIW